MCLVSVAQILQGNAFKLLQVLETLGSESARPAIAPQVSPLRKILHHWRTKLLLRCHFKITRRERQGNVFFLLISALGKFFVQVNSVHIIFHQKKGSIVSQEICNIIVVIVFVEHPPDAHLPTQEIRASAHNLMLSFPETNLSLRTTFINIFLFRRKSGTSHRISVPLQVNIDLKT